MYIDPEQVLRQANEAIMKGDNEGFLSYCTEDTEWTFVGEMTLRGKDAVRQWMKSNYQEPPEFVLETVIKENNRLAALGVITLKDKNGKESLHKYCDVWAFRDGKMSGLQAFVIKPGKDEAAHLK